MKMSFKATMLLVITVVIFGCKKESNVATACTECSLIPEVGECNAAFPKYYFDLDSLKCKEFTWGGCNGVVPFETLQDCLDCECSEE